MQAVAESLSYYRKFTIFGIIKALRGRILIYLVLKEYQGKLPQARYLSEGNVGAQPSSIT